MSDKSLGGFEIHDISTNKWWVQQIQDIQNWAPGGVFVVFLGPANCIAPAAAWFTTAAQLKTLARGRLFTSLLVVCPPGQERLNCKNSFLAAVNSAYDNSSNGVPEIVREHLTEAATVLEESNSEKIIEHLEALRAGSAVAICAAQRLRFNDFASLSEAGTKTHTGFNVRNVKAQDLTFPHLFALLRRLLEIATSRNLSVVVFVEQFSMELESMPQDIRNHSQLAHCTTHDNPALKARYHAILKADEIRRLDGLEAALLYVSANFPEAEDHAHAVSIILGAQGHWFEAWHALKPCLKTLKLTKDPSILLNVSIAAAACGEAKEALSALEAALTFGIGTVEQFNAAALVARKIEAWEIQAKLLKGMMIAFPDHPMTMGCSFDYLIRTHKYSEAAAMAHKAGHQFEKAWALLKSQAMPDWESFFLVAKATQRETEALEKAVYYELDCGDLQKAGEYLDRIKLDAANSLIRAQALLEIIARRIQFAKTNDELGLIEKDFSEVLRYIALNPTETDLRSRLNHIFDVTLDDQSKRLLLVYSCIKAFGKANHLFRPQNASNEKCPYNFDNLDDSCNEYKCFLEAVAKVNQGCPLGRGIIPKEYQTGVSDEVMSAICVLILGLTKEPDLGVIATALQSLNIACRIRKESAWDFQAAIQLLSTLATHGKVSDAFNLAETILLFWPYNLPEFQAARLSHSWSCMAEVYHRARNPLTALLHLNICFVAMVAEPAPQHVCMLKQKMRLGFRIFRDLRFNQFARMFISCELALVKTYPERKRELKEVLTSDISCRLHDINKDTPPNEITDIFDISRTLLDDPDETEWGPPVSVGFSLLNICRDYGFKIPAGFPDLVLSKSAKCPRPIRQLFSRFLMLDPTVEDINSQMRDIIDANVNDDHGQSFFMAEGLLRRAIKSSCKRNDAELFLLAATWLSQPALAASRAKWEVDGALPEVKLAKINEIFPGGFEQSTARALDYAKAMEDQISRTQSNFKKLIPLPLSAVRFVAATNEALCFLVHDSDKRLCRLVVRRDGIDGPIQLSNIDWNHDRFIEWQKEYPEDYSWDRQYASLGSYDVPDLDIVRASLTNLQPMIPIGSQIVTILPEADLFGFTFFLNETSGRWIGELTQCVTAPSLPWLATVRQLAQKPAFSMKGWLGHPTLADNAVLRPRGELKPIIEKHKGEIIAGETPKPLRQSEIAIILSHGSRGLFRNFVGVNDVGQFSNEDLVHCLGESKCVIFFVCNAGRNDGQIFNNETFGLVGRLLQRDVRVVIAPPAPLRNDLPAIWLEPFLESLRRGDSVGNAHANACAVIRAQFAHPCAWGALQLFGDANLSFQLSV